MCLMCEFYLDICDEPACVEAARLRGEDETQEKSKRLMLREEHYTNRSGKSSFLWKGYSEKPCKHIKANHGPHCTVVERAETDYGLLFDTCNCEPQANGDWIYY